MPEEIPTSETAAEKEEPKPKAVKKVKTFLNKVVIRKLPPSLTSEDFLEIISPVPAYYDFYFVRADWSLGAEATSRAYIEFKNQEDVRKDINLLKSFFSDCRHCRFSFSKTSLTNTYSWTASEEQSMQQLSNSRRFRAYPSRGHARISMSIQSTLSSTI
jgi:hypothetical protein